MQFHKNQLQAVCHNRGPAMVLAGPGSGKTTVITHRIRYLIEESKIPPSQILVITFTRAAAMEMEERFLRLTQQNYHAVSFGTFHAIFFQIVKQTSHYGPSSIIREEQKKEFLRECLARFELEIEDEKEYVQDLIGEISTVKNRHTGIDQFNSTVCPTQIFQTVFREYEAMLQKRHLIDFDDMLLQCYRILSEDPSVLRIWQKQYPYILIDEFQDINQLQFDVIRLLAGHAENLFIVGDDDQSIYGFRGARPEIMLDFPRIYPACRQIPLTVNYRSRPEIVAAARTVIEENTLRYRKELTAAKSEKLEKSEKSGCPVRIQEFSDLEEENAWIVSHILQAGEVEYPHTAILVRTHAMAGSLMQKLTANGIPFSSGMETASIYDFYAAQDIFSYLDIAHGSVDRGDFLRIWNKPLRYLSRNALSEHQVDLEKVKSYYSDQDWMTARIVTLQNDLRELSVMPPFAAINYIRHKIGYDDYLHQHCKEMHLREERAFSVLDELQEEARKHRTYGEWENSIAEWKEKLEEQKRNVQNNKMKGKNVTICTMHAAKGLEYRHVYIPDVNESIIPYRKAILLEQIEEERRMFYVAMTRAKEELFLCYTKERYNKKMEFSRFLEALQPERIPAGSLLQSGMQWIYFSESSPSSSA